MQKLQWTSSGYCVDATHNGRSQAVDDVNMEEMAGERDVEMLDSSRKAEMPGSRHCAHELPENVKRETDGSLG